MSILQDLSKLSQEQLVNIILAQQEAAKQKITFKVSPNKGAVMICGLGKIPATLYASQWLRILDHADQLRSWIEANKSALAWKS